MHSGSRPPAKRVLHGGQSRQQSPAGRRLGHDRRSGRVRRTNGFVGAADAGPLLTGRRPWRRRAPRRVAAPTSGVGVSVAATGAGQRRRDQRALRWRLRHRLLPCPLPQPQTGRPPRLHQALRVPRQQRAARSRPPAPQLGMQHGPALGRVGGRRRHPLPNPLRAGRGEGVSWVMRPPLLPRWPRRTRIGPKSCSWRRRTAPPRAISRLASSVLARAARRSVGPPR